MSVQKHFEKKLIQRVACHAAFIRAHGRYPVSLNMLWPTLAMLVFYSIIELIYWFSGWYDRGHLFLLLINVSVFISIATLNIRALFFGCLKTGMASGEAIQQMQVALAAAGYSLEWTPTYDAAVLFVTAGGGSLAKHHAVVFVPADGCIWYNVHDPRGTHFFVTKRKPLRSLISGLEKGMDLHPFFKS